MDVELFIACGYDHKKYQEEMDKRRSSAEKEAPQANEHHKPDEKAPSTQKTNQNNPYKGGKPSGSGSAAGGKGGVNFAEGDLSQNKSVDVQASMRIQTTQGGNRVTNRRNAFNQKWSETTEPPLNVRIAFTKIS
jgi:hypothetical protein